MRKASVICAIFWLFAFLTIRAHAGLDVSSPVQSVNGQTGAVNLTLGVTQNTNGQLPSMNGGVAPSTMFVSTANAAMASTSDSSCIGATGAGTQTVPANGAYVGNRYRIICKGTYTVPLANTATLTAKLKWGSTTVASVVIPPAPVSLGNYPFWVEVTCTVRSVGANGTIACQGTVSYSLLLTATSITVGPILTNAVSTINTTVASTLDMTGAWSSVAGGQSATAIDASIEILY